MNLLGAVMLCSLAGPACAAPPTQIQSQPFAGDKPAHRVESTNVTQNVDGTTTVSTVLVYEDGTKEHCTIVMSATTSPRNQVKAPQSRTCNPIP